MHIPAFVFMPFAEDGNMARVPVAVVEILSTGNTFMYLGSFSPDAIWEGETIMDLVIN